MGILMVVFNQPQGTLEVAARGGGGDLVFDSRLSGGGLVHFPVCGKSLPFLCVVFYGFMV